MNNILKRNFKGLQNFEEYLGGLEEVVKDINVNLLNYSDCSWIKFIEEMIDRFPLRSKLLHIDNMFIKLYREEQSFIEYGLSLKKGSIVKVENIFPEERIIATNYLREPKTYLVPVVWQEAGIMRIKADFYEEAMHIAIHEKELPKDADYLCDSLVIDTESIFYGEEAD